MPEIPYIHGHPSIVRGGSWTNTEPLAPHLKILVCVLFSSVQFCHSVMSDSLRTHGLQHTRLRLSITSCWSLLKLMSIELVMPCNHLILCCPLLPPSIFPASGFFPRSQFFTSGGQHIGVSASASFLPMNIQTDFF